MVGTFLPAPRQPHVPWDGTFSPRTDGNNEAAIWPVFCGGQSEVCPTIGERGGFSPSYRFCAKQVCVRGGQCDIRTQVRDFLLGKLSKSLDLSESLTLLSQKGHRAPPVSAEVEKHAGGKVPVGARRGVAAGKCFLELGSVPSFALRKARGHCQPERVPTARLVSAGPWEEALCVGWHDMCPLLVDTSHSPVFAGLRRTLAKPVGQLLDTAEHVRGPVSVLRLQYGVLPCCSWGPSSWEWGLFLASVSKTKTRSRWETVPFPGC